MSLLGRVVTVHRVNQPLRTSPCFLLGLGRLLSIPAFPFLPAFTIERCCISFTLVEHPPAAHLDTIQ